MVEQAVQGSECRRGEERKICHQAGRQEHDGEKKIN